MQESQRLQITGESVLPGFHVLVIEPQRCDDGGKYLAAPEEEE